MMTLQERAAQIETFEIFRLTEDRCQCMLCCVMNDGCQIVAPRCCHVGKLPLTFVFKFRTMLHSDLIHRVCLPQSGAPSNLYLLLQIVFQSSLHLHSFYAYGEGYVSQE
jgi:hypothetical protein